MVPRLIAPVFFVFLSLATFADTLTGKVVKITDGDTLYVLDANYKEHKIRLAGIDAPERKQALWISLPQALSFDQTWTFTNGCFRPQADVRGLGVSGTMTFL